MSGSIDKAALIRAFRDHLTARRATLTGAQADARAGTRVDGDHRPENRGERAAVTAQGYLAHGLGARVAELDGMLEALAEVSTEPTARVASGAVVRVVDEAEVEQAYLVLPGGQGDRLEGVVVVSPRSPLVRALQGAAVGDLREVQRPSGGQWVEVVDIG